MLKSSKWIVEPDTNGNGVLGWTEHRTKKEALEKIAYWLSRGIVAELIKKENLES
jgi:hypothetical protein